jgi:citrate lyase subunit beta / citryl-CoA lyase
MRSRLFVPGSRPELFLKAMNSGADVVCFDLQDAVALDKKDVARDAVVGFLRTVPELRPKPKIMVRVNPTTSEHFGRDLAAIVGPGLDVINLPMVETGQDVRTASVLLDRLERQRDDASRLRMLVNIELPRAVRLAAEIAAADTRVMGLQVGFGDMFEPFRIKRTSTAAINAVRMSVRLAAAEVGIPVFDAAFTAVSQPEKFREEAESARELGLSGKTCIHPSQVAIANEVFSASPEEIAWARRVVKAGDEAIRAGVGAVLLDGVMIDAPFIEGARALLDQVGRRE